MPFHHFIIAIIVSTVWGVNFVVMKIGLDHLSPFLFVSLRFAIVFLLLVYWMRIVKGSMKQIMWVGLCLGGFHFAFAILGLELAENVTSIIVIVQMHVPLTLILAHIFLQEKLSYFRGSAIALSFLGILIITFDPMIVNERIAILIIFIATLCYSMGAILMRKLKDVAVLNTQGWTGLFGLPVVLSLSLMVENNHIEQIMNMNLAGWATVFYTAVFSSVVGYGGMNFLLRRHPVTIIAPIFLTTPIFAVVAAVIVFDEVMTPRFLIGSGVTLFGLVLIHLRDWWKKRQVVEELLP